MKTKLLLACLGIILCFTTRSQCLTPPLFPDCTGTDPLVASNEALTISQTKWYYGASATLSNVKLQGGTLIVCSDLTINDLVLDSGTIVVKAGAKLIVSNGAGLVMKGGCAIYNWGTFQCLGNIVMDWGTASTSRPNIIINATTSAVWQMPNQYFVINNPYSWFVNMGTASFHGIITDPQAAKGSVCLGNASQVNMMVLYNKAKLPYVVPNGMACVSVSQYSQFYDTLTNNPNLNICLSSYHTSDASCTPWGCKPNAWGGAQVMLNCSSCASSFTVLPIKFEFVRLTPYNEIQWKVNETTAIRLFYVQCSFDGIHFNAVDSVQPNNSGAYVRKYSLNESDIHYYRIQAITANGSSLFSTIIKSLPEYKTSTVFPNPFKDQVTVLLPGAKTINGITLTDILGRKLKIKEYDLSSSSIKISIPDLPKGVYMLQVKNKNELHFFKLQKE
ncbi:MAG: T9SS type A sorting domain-containing protein [Flavisolibacter sp.]|jgi:hypothetical protein